MKFIKFQLKFGLNDCKTNIANFNSKSSFFSVYKDIQ